MASPSDQTSSLNKVCIWTVPRTLGTALTKCLSYVDGVQIFYEPCASAFHFGPESKRLKDPDLATYVEKASANQPSTFENAFDDNKCTYAWIRQQLEADYPGKKILLVKDQAYCLDDRYDTIPPGLRHAFLIRHPYKAMASLKNLFVKLLNVNPASADWEVIRKSLDYPNLYEKQFKLLQYVQEKFDPNPVIIDADDLQSNPASILRQFCQRVEIPYSDSLLEWPADRDIMKTWKGSRVALQGNMLKNEGGFFENALRSTGFHPPKPTPKRSELPEDLLDVCDYSLTFYEQMYQLRLKP